MIRELTKVYQTDDGQVWGTMEEAQTHEMRKKLRGLVGCIYRDSQFHPYGEHGGWRRHEAFVEALLKAGFVFKGEIKND